MKSFAVVMVTPFSVLQVLKCAQDMFKEDCKKDQNHGDTQDTGSKVREAAVLLY